MPPVSQTVLIRIKRAAKARARAGLETYSQALEWASQQEGFASWHAVTSGSYLLPIDPDLPPDFDSTPNEDRPPEQLATWWDRPFALRRADGKLEVRCLDGGAWDRSTFYGVAPDLPSAAELAQAALARWRTVREAPYLYIDSSDEKPYVVVRGPLRPREGLRELARFRTGEEAARYRDAQAQNASGGDVLTPESKDAGKRRRSAPR